MKNIKVVVEDGRTATFQSFDEAEEWIREYVKPDVYAAAWDVMNNEADESLREYHTEIKGYQHLGGRQ
jgi:hypothetical protein